MLRIVAFLSCIAFFSLSAQNFGTKINSHIFRFSDTLETVGVEDALGVERERTHYRWGFRASYDRVGNSVIAIDAASGNTILEYVDNVQTLTLGGSYLFGHSKKILLGLRVPLHIVKLTTDGAAITGGTANSNEFALGDSAIYLKWRLTPDNSKWNIALNPRLVLPTGDEQLLVSDGALGVGLRVLVDRTFGKFSFFGHLGFINVPDAGFLSINRSQRAEAALAMAWKLTNFWSINAEINSDIVIDGGVEDNQNSFDAIAGARMAFKKAKVFFGASLSGLQDSTSHEFGVYAGVKTAIGPIVVPIDPGPKVVVEEKDLVPVEVMAPIQQRVQVSETTLFQFSKSIISERGKRDLNKAAAVIIHFQDRLGKIAVEGHTDTVGPKGYNQKLSESRAKAVRKYLISRGVLAEKLIAIGYGEERPQVFPEKTRADRQANRRAEFFIDEVITIREI